MSDITFNDYNPGEFYHRYILGLYRVMNELTKEFPDVLFEGCASGGNRFDLGILSYFPQIWASDDTDAMERLRIQENYYLGYPQSTVSCHVSCSPSHQMLRNTPIDTRFNIAMFGVMGYELIFKELTKQERIRCKKLVEVYKANRKEFQFGELDILESYSDNFRKWQVIADDKTSTVVGHFNILQKSNAPEAFLDTKGLIDEKQYQADVVHIDHDIHKFGGLINMITPFHVKPNGWLVNVLSKHITMPGEKDNYLAYGSAFNNKAVILNPEWSASGFNDGVRVLGDFGSRLYTFKIHEEN